MPGRGYSSEPVTLSFPPFTRAIAWLIGINTALYLLLRLLSLSAATAGAASAVVLFASLTPAAVVHYGWLWQLATYDFLHLDLLALIVNMIMLWMFGAQIEQTWGSRRFLGLYFTSLVGAALITIAAAYSGMPGVSPNLAVRGAAAGVYGVLIAFAVLFAESEFMMFPLPVLIKAKYMAWILIVITLALSLREMDAWLAVPQLGGIVFGYLYVKLAQRRRARAQGGVYRGRFPAPAQAPSAPQMLERWRDSYYRWRRRRAARKFEVYMRKHNREVFFDEQGNYIDPDSARARRRDQDEGKDRWVN